MNEPASVHVAVSLFRQGQYDEAAAVCRSLLASEPGNVGANHILGKIAYMDERYEDSIRFLEPVVRLNRENFELLIEFGRVLRLAGKTEQAIECLEHALSPTKTYSAYLELGLALADANNFVEAKRMLRQAIALKPNCPYSLRRLGKIAREQGDYPEAVRYCQQLADAFPKTVHSYPDLIKSHLLSGDPQAALDACEKCLVFEPACTGVLAFKYIALSELGDRKGANYLCDLRLVKRFHIAPPAGYSTIEEFNECLAAHILKHTTRTSTPEQYTTVSGWQTENGTLFDQAPLLGKQVEKIIEDKVKDYIAQLANDPDHPLALGTPTATQLAAWAVVLDRHGHQAPHTHPASWISGCYYVKLPEDFDSQPDPNAGCIAFGRGEEGLHSLKEPETVVLRPAAGDMVLFPSYYWHNTFPLQSQQKRICVAFDVVPTKGWGK